MAIQMFFSAIVFLVLVSAVLAIPGGWTKVDVNTDEVKTESSFAVQTQFPGQVVDFVTISALKQVSFVFFFFVKNFSLIKFCPGCCGIKV